MTLGCGGPRDQDNVDLTGITFPSGGGSASDTSGTGSVGGASDSGGGSDASGGGSVGGATMGPRFDVGNSGPTTDGGDPGGCGEPDPTNATLVGTVFAPNLEIPISGALVYLRDGSPDPVPDGVYCAECVQIPCGKHAVLTDADGSFSLPASAGPQTLVVIKGQFMHAVDVNVVEGTNAIAPADSNLPGVWNPADGKWIPRIAVVEATEDLIQDVLGKIGLGTVNSSGQLQSGSAQFDLLSPQQGLALMDDLDAMRGYHIIFVPCLGPGQSGILGSSRRVNNIRQWVDEGGKWYVTDWANEYLWNVFAPYQTFHGGGPWPGDLETSYDTTATVIDPDLLAWLQALPAPLKDIGGGSPDLLSLPQVEVVDSWSGFDAIPPVLVQDQDGNDVNVGHYPWVEGTCRSCVPSSTVRPMTVSGSYGCGRLMFSTYHTVEAGHIGLTPQELISLHIILEIGVCHDSTPPPPPPVG